MPQSARILSYNMATWVYVCCAAYLTNTQTPYISAICFVVTHEG